MCNHRARIIIILVVPFLLGLVATASWKSVAVRPSPIAQISGSDSRFRGPVPGRPGFGPRRRLPQRSEFPTWEVDPEFARDVWTFARVAYQSNGPFGWWDRWDNDYPDGDWNFSYRLQELTSLRVANDSVVVRLTDPELYRYPFLYMAGVHWMVLDPMERTNLRRYLLNGGFLMMDDFWTPTAWRNVRREMDAVLPGRPPVELTLDHPIFHQVYDLQTLPQVVDIRTWQRGDRYEFNHGASDGDMAPHFWAYFDDHERMVALCCHNNDLGDGWEREGENVEYFQAFSERFSYPMGINILVYAMTH